MLVCLRWDDGTNNQENVLLYFWGHCHHVLLQSLQVHALNGGCKRCSLDGESSERMKVY